MLRPDDGLELLLAIPAVYTVGMTDEDWQKEIDRMAKSSRLTQDFAEGNLSPADLQDGLADLNLNPYELEEAWAEGISFLL